MFAQRLGVVLAVLAAGMSSGCDVVALLGGFPKPTITTRSSLPVELAYRAGSDGLVILTGRVNGRVDVEFILDTGASVTVLIANAHTAPLGFDTSKARRLGPADDPASPTGVIERDLALTFGDVALTGLAAVVLPESTLACPERFREVGFEGVIGADLFRRFVVDVDPARQRVTLHEPATWTPPSGAAVVPIRLESGHAYIDATLVLSGGERVTLPLHVDTGMTTALALVGGSHPSLAMPTQGEATRSCFVSGRREVRRGLPVGVRLGTAAFDGVAPRFAEKRDVPSVQQAGAVGSGLLSTRRYVIDYPGKRLVVL